MGELTYLGVSKNNYKVFVDLESSHAATHFIDSPKLFEVVKESIPLVEILEDKVRVEYDTGIVVGDSDLVEIQSGDEVVYALRLHRDRHSKFVKNRFALPTTWIVMSFVKIKGDTYYLQTAFVGRLTPSFPGGDYLPEQSADFWSKHALAWGNQQIVPDSETKECPW